MPQQLQLLLAFVLGNFLAALFSEVAHVSTLNLLFVIKSRHNPSTGVAHLITIAQVVKKSSAQE